MRKGYYQLSRADKRRGRGKIHLGITPGGQKVLCHAERNGFVSLIKVDVDPRTLEYIKGLVIFNRGRFCKRCITKAERLEREGKK